MEFDNKDFVTKRFLMSSKEDHRDDRVQKVISLLPKQGKLLEIGPFEGLCTQEYRKIFDGKISGMDLNLDIMKSAMPYLDDAKACDLNTDKFPWDDSTFDTVICTEVIEHIFDTDQLLTEINRVLKKNGNLIISTPNLSSFVNKIFILFGMQPIATEVSARMSTYGNRFRRPSNITAGHIRNFTYSAFEDIIKHNGFQIKKATSIPMTTRKGIHELEKIVGWLKTSLGGNPIILAKKR